MAVKRCLSIRWGWRRSRRSSLKKCPEGCCLASTYSTQTFGTVLLGDAIFIVLTFVSSFLQSPLPGGEALILHSPYLFIFLLFLLDLSGRLGFSLPGLSSCGLGLLGVSGSPFPGTSGEPGVTPIFLPLLSFGSSSDVP